MADANVFIVAAGAVNAADDRAFSAKTSATM
jgi:hypothetical protein